MAVQREERRLAAILSADVVGYSRLMGADESGTLARLKTHRGEIIDPKIAEHHGRIAKLMGDGVLVEFASVVDAVQCATDIQRAMADRNADVAEERRIELRIGINVGDIIVDGDDIYGDGVNVAARLEGLAEPGGVCISRSTRDQVRDKLDLALKDMGEVEVKNIARPVRVFRIHIAEQGLAPPPDSPRTSAGRARTSDQQSIAVLPFENMSGDPEQEYFADGIAEDIITALSKVSGMFVIARNSSFTYKGQAVPVQKVSNALGVRHILEGSVRKAGNRVRITAQLVDGTSGGHLWAERYDRDLKDIFAVQDDVNQQIVSALEVELKAGEDKRLVEHETDDVVCYDFLLRGRELPGRASPPHRAGEPVRTARTPGAQPPVRVRDLDRWQPAVDQRPEAQARGHVRNRPQGMGLGRADADHSARRGEAAARQGVDGLLKVSIGCESRMAVMSAAWFVEFRQRLPWLLQVD